MSRRTRARRRHVMARRAAIRCWAQRVYDALWIDAAGRLLKPGVDILPLPPDRFHGAGVYWDLDTPPLAQRP